METTVGQKMMKSKKIIHLKITDLELQDDDEEPIDTDQDKFEYFQPRILTPSALVKLWHLNSLP